ncbi:phytanoyl-coa dioxygenase domain-containing protein 1-like protein [Plakobranchus ocellatus]|uniref:Phytanoyl-coa dioxygenase domain-containing protein 1-like protein n=1 Tax=Plakobranchus ocellatus TaxID=259542 RepID=A0AAV4BSW3_9GAST|nr:phytanoyl-coa dioxygenase domain-containing protein 1-like protein [Plakobranchus ocellatus]
MGRDVGKLVNSRLFRTCTPLDHNDLFEVENAKSKVRWNLPLQIGFFVYQYAKLRMLQFHYDFVDKFVSRDDYQLCEMDTDSLYMALSGNSLEEVVKTHLLQRFYREYPQWFPARSCDAHHEEFVSACSRGEAWNPRPCCKERSTFDKRTPGLFKIEIVGDGMGFLTVPNFFYKDELDACRRDVGKCVEDLAQALFKAGKIKDLHEDAGLFERLTLIEREYADANVLLHRPRTKHYLYEGFRNLWANERLLNLIEQLLGPNIMGNPVWNLRPKVPSNESLVIPWHQDAAYTGNELYGLLVPTAWIPLLDATKENGCLEVVRGGHRTGRVARHIGCYKDTWYLSLPEDEMEQVLEVDLNKDKVLCELSYGSLVIFNNMVPHRGLENTSNSIRWSMDLRWMVPSEAGGWYGKTGVLMRSGGQTLPKIDWDGFLQQNEEDKKKEEREGLDMFEPIFTSPYFERWQITNYNKHVQKYFEQKKKSQLAL